MNMNPIKGEKLVHLGVVKFTIVIILKGFYITIKMSFNILEIEQIQQKHHFYNTMETPINNVNNDPKITHSI